MYLGGNCRLVPLGVFLRAVTVFVNVMARMKTVFDEIPLYLVLQLQ